jgi:hypothetical protein
MRVWPAPLAIRQVGMEGQGQQFLVKLLGHRQFHQALPEKAEQLVELIMDAGLDAPRRRKSRKASRYTRTGWIGGTTCSRSVSSSRSP